MAADSVCPKEKLHFVWQTQKPRLYSRFKSPRFILYNKKCQLELISRNVASKGVMWYIYLRLSKNSSYRSKLLVTTYIQSRKGNLVLLCPTSNTGKRFIWSGTGTSVMSRNPDIEVNGILTFVFVFDTVVDTICDLREQIGIVATAPSDDHEPNSFLKELPADVLKMMEEDELLDPQKRQRCKVRLKCGRHIIWVNSYVLSTRSEVFKIMLQSDMREKRDGVVKIANIEFSILRIFLQYLYTETLSTLAMEDTIELYKTADLYAVESLKKVCSQLLMQKVTYESALILLLLADTYNDDNFKDRLMSYIAREKVPKKYKMWKQFCNCHPALSIEVLNYVITS